MVIPSHVQRAGEVLLAARVIDQEQLAAVIRRVQQWGSRLAAEVVEMRYAHEAAVVDALAQASGMPRIDLSAISIDRHAVNRLDGETCKARGIFPFSLAQQVLSLAVADPFHRGLVDEVAQSAGLRVRPYLAPESMIQRAIQRFHYNIDITLKAADAPTVAEVGEFKLTDNFGRTMNIPASAIPQVAQSGAAPAAHSGAPPKGSIPRPAPTPPVSTLVGLVTPAPESMERAVATLEQRVVGLQKALELNERVIRSLVAVLTERKVLSLEEIRLKISQLDKPK